MRIEAIYKEGLYVKITGNFSVFYQKDQCKVKLLKDREMINSFVIDPKEYTLNQFIEYCGEIEKRAQQ